MNLRLGRFVLCLVLIAATAGCTVVKPVVCAIGYPIKAVGERIDRASDREADDLATPVLLVAFPVLFPLNYAYWTAHGAVSGVFSGFVNDLNLITGSGSMDRTWETMLEPQKTNAVAK